MKSSVDITLSHFCIEEGRALAADGELKLGRVDTLELLQILMIFQDISPIQSFKGEPTINIKTRLGSFVVKTDLHRLILYDTKRMHEPSRVLEAAAIILEIDDVSKKHFEDLNARLTRTAVEHRTPLMIIPRLLTPILVVLAVLAALINLYLHYPQHDNSGPDDVILDQHEKLARFYELMGTYSTGSKPGDYAIMVLPSGEVRFLEITAAPPPREIRDACEIGHVQGRLCIITHQPGGLITVVSKDTLAYGGALYRQQP